MNDSADPWTSTEIVAELTRVERESRAYWEQFTPDAFLAPLGAAWSPSDNVRHLTKSIRPVATALRLPRLVLWFRFGRAQRPSRRYGVLRHVYLARLAAGASAGRFAPSAAAPPSDPVAARARILAAHQTVVTALAIAVARWDERALDRYRLPHPLLGALTVREMLFFTLYHNQHHVAVVRQRAGAVR